jgi:mono/diheme cytochrome c family protein
VKRIALVVALVAAFGVLAAGCSKNSSSDNSASATSGPTTEAASSGAKSAGASGDPVRGKQLFTQNCASCHGADGTQGGVGPSLKNEKSRKDTAAAIAWIKNPQPPMPKLYPSPLSEKDVVDLAAYVETL